MASLYLARLDDTATLRQEWVSMMYDSFDLTRGLGRASASNMLGTLKTLLRNLSEACVRGRYLSIPITACRASRVARNRILDVLQTAGIVDDVKIGYSRPIDGVLYKELTSMRPTPKVFDAIDHRDYKVSEKWAVVNRVSGEDVPIRRRVDENRLLTGVAKHAQRRCNVPIHHFRRVFNSGEEFGGRVYSPYQQMPKAHRAHIMIDGEDTVEVDYMASQIRLGFALLGSPLDGDPYSGLGVERDVAKKAINVMLNARRPAQVFRDSRYSSLFGWDAERAIAFMEQVYSRHPEFKLLVGVDIGKRLQRLEGDIATHLMRDFKAAGEVILPVHDSYIVRKGARDFLVELMDKAWHNVVSVERGNFFNMKEHHECGF